MSYANQKTTTKTTTASADKKKTEDAIKAEADKAQAEKTAKEKAGITTPDSGEPPKYTAEQNEQARAYLQKYGRTINVPLMPMVTMNAFPQGRDLEITSYYGLERDGDNHGGTDFGRGLKHNTAKMYASASGKVLYRATGHYVVDRGLKSGDRLAHLHSTNSLSAGKILKGAVVANPTAYGTAITQVGDYVGLIAGWGKGKYNAYAAHDHVEYHVRSSDPRLSVRVQRTGDNIYRNTKHQRGSIYGLGGFKQIDISPYYAHDVPMQLGMARMAKYKEYTGKTMYSNHNVLYNTQLPVALFVPSALGKSSVQSNPSPYLPTKKFSKTLFTGSAFAGVNIGLDFVGTVNAGIIDSTVAYESAGFNMGQPIYTTQRMLVSHLSDTDGETWTTIFGNAPSATTEEMSQNELVHNLAEKRYGNSEWLANIAKLSTKGLFTEYLIQEAEINRLLGLIMELRQQQMQQEAILSRVMLDGKDKAIENLTEMIAVNAPTFMNARLEKSGDEWHEEQVVTGYSGEYSVGGASIDLGNLPTDIKGLQQALLEAVAGHESRGSYNAYNRGTAKGCYGKGHMGKNPDSYAPITQMTPAQILTRYYGRPYGKGESTAVSCDRRIFAVGKYQWIPKTLSDMIMRAEFKPYHNQPFTPENQEKLAAAYFFSHKRPAIGKFLQSGSDKEAAKRSLAHEWASIAMPAGEITENGTKSLGCPSQKVCSTYYNKKKGNRAFYSSTMKVWAILDAIEAYHKNKGSSGSSK